MKIIQSIEETRRIVGQARREGQTVGLVPTMGALHEGHFSLIRRCREECDYSVVSIYVNPAQFGPGEDLKTYPRTFEADCDACREMGLDLLFAPSNREMYPRENLTWIQVEKISEHLCGASRPGFFRGVGTIVTKLFNIICPNIAYFGQKDAQQLAVIRRMVTDLNMPVEIRGCPTIREADGLALSSRNQYLTARQRQQALCLSKALNHAAKLIGNGQTNPEMITKAMEKIVREQPEAKIDYISIVDKDLLHPLPEIDQPVLIAMAVLLGSARLIDNIIVDPAQKKS